MWDGMNLASQTTFKLSADERQQMVARGELSPFALRPTFRPLAEYEDLVSPRPPTGVPVLDRATKTNGGTNFNNEAFITIDQHYRSDALTVAQTHPSVLAHSMLSSTYDFFVPAADYV